MTLLQMISGLGPVFYKLVYMSLTGLAAGAIVLLLRRLADKRFSPFWKYAMWLLVLAALVVPWRPQSRAAVLSPAEAVQEISFREDYNRAQSEYDTMLAKAPQLPQVTPEVEAARREATSLRAKTLAFDALLPLLWLCGTAGAAIFMGIGAIRLRRKVKRTALACDMARYEALLASCQESLGMKRRVRIILQTHVGTPALMGVLRPVILLPAYAENMSDAHLEYVILHELSHLKRGDGLVNALLLAIRAVYWFNPLVWLLLKFVREDMELANDAAVLKGMGQEERKEYSLSLVEVLMGCGKQRHTMLCMTDGKKNIERRIGMIQLGEFFKRRKWVIAVAGVLVIAGTAALFLTTSLKQIELPEEYRPLLEGIHRLVLTAREEDGDWDWIREPEMSYLESQYLGGTDYTTEGNMGYALADINNDGVPELLWLGKSRENPKEFLLYALFTLQDGSPVRLYDRGQRFPGVLARDGTLYVATGTAMETILYSYKLEPGAAELTQLTEYTKNAEEIDADEAFKKLRDEYTKPPRPMKFTFIPIEEIAKKALAPEKNSALMTSLGYTQEALKTIQKNKTPYVGENAKVDAIVQQLPVTWKGLAYDHISLQTREEPYGLTVYYKEHEETLTDWQQNPFSEAMEENNALLLFSAIENLGEVTFAMPGDMQSSQYTRDEISAIFGGIPSINDLDAVYDKLSRNLKMSEFYWAHPGRLFLRVATPEDVVYRYGGEPDKRFVNESGLTVYEYHTSSYYIDDSGQEVTDYEETTYFYFDDAKLYAVKTFSAGDAPETYNDVIAKFGQPTMDKTMDGQRYIAYLLRRDEPGEPAKYAYFVFENDRVIENGWMSGDDFAVLSTGVYDKPLEPTFLSPKQGREALKPLIWGSEGWWLDTQGDYIFAHFWRHIVRYDVKTNKIDKIIDLGDAPQHWWYAATYSPDGRYCVAQAQEFDGPGQTGRVLIDLKNETVKPTEQEHYPHSFDSNPYQVESRLLEHGYGWFLNDAEIKALRPYAGTITEIIPLDNNRVGALMPVSADASGYLGYYKFAVIDLAQDKIVQECIMNVLDKGEEYPTYPDQPDEPEPLLIDYHLKSVTVLRARFPKDGRSSYDGFDIVKVVDAPAEVAGFEECLKRSAWEPADEGNWLKVEPSSPQADTLILYMVGENGQGLALHLFDDLDSEHPQGGAVSMAMYGTLPDSPEKYREYIIDQHDGLFSRYWVSWDTYKILYGLTV